jgi:hypothetical protein
MKKTLIALAVAILVTVIGAVFWLRGNLDGLVKNAIQDYGTAMTQATVSVGAVQIQPTDGRGNPKGYKTPHALKVGEIEVAIDIASVAKDVVVIRKIAIVAPDVIYEKGEVMTNFDAIQKHIAEYLGPGEKKEGGKKLIVEELTIRNAKAQASAAFMDGKTVTVALPDITLRDIGKAKGGVTPAELGNEIAKAIKGKLSAAVSFDALAKSAGKALDKAGSAIKGLFK